MQVCYDFEVMPVTDVQFAEEGLLQQTVFCIFVALPTREVDRNKRNGRNHSYLICSDYFCNSCNLVEFHA